VTAAGKPLYPYGFLKPRPQGRGFLFAGPCVAKLKIVFCDNAAIKYVGGNL
jgi:hypothetical protein